MTSEIKTCQALSKPQFKYPTIQWRNKVFFHIPFDIPIDDGRDLGIGYSMHKFARTQIYIKEFIEEMREKGIDKMKEKYYHLLVERLPQ